MKGKLHAEWMAHPSIEITGLMEMWCGAVIDQASAARGKQRVTCKNCKRSLRAHERKRLARKAHER